MQQLDLSLAEPADNLALDEALLEGAEQDRTGELLRWWESPKPFVVLGAGCPAATEVIPSVCTELNVPVLRRCSGGGTVVQGPGCLNYTFVVDRETRSELATIDGTNRFILGTVIDALKQCGVESELQGISDLTCGGTKFSGNAQRRRKRWVLFHGTVLYSFDLASISRCLAEPEKQPDYRQKRNHQSFVQNVTLDLFQFKTHLAKAWNVAADLTEWPQQRVAELVAEKYSQHSWNFGL